MDDTISRADAIDEIARWIGYLDDDMIGRIQLGLKRLPSVQPERKKGKWVHSTVYTDNRGCEFAKCKCSNCGHEEFAISYNVTHGKYCPNCGSYNGGENHDKG